MRKYMLLLGLFGWLACGPENPSGGNDPALAGANWGEIEAAARGKTVNLMMWQGDPFINAYVEHFIKPEVLDRFGIELQVSSGQGNQIVSVLLAELEAGKSTSELDLCWINGETFYQLRQIDALYGPFTEKLPNSEYLDLDNPFIRYDFQQEIDGYECPWGNVQQAIIYDTTRVKDPPMTRAELLAWVKANPGRFTLPNEFTGMSLLKAWLIDIAGGKGSLNGPFEEETYEQYSAELWKYVRQLQPYFWKKGETFPASLAQMHQMFTNGELDFTLSMNDGEVENKILQGVFPETVRAYVPDHGTIRNTHFMGIPRLAPDKAAAMVVINFMISPEAQYQKLRPEIWGDGSILKRDALSLEWQEQFGQIAARRYAPPREALLDRALQEPAPQYMIRLFDDFRQEIIKGE
jgi:putative spermidine/putrescine transport system substrate-binding protein